MDIVTQLQDQTNHMASLLFNYVGTLQRDAPPVPLKGKLHGQEPVKKEPGGAEDAAAALEEQTREMASAFVQSVKLFNAMCDALPVEEGGEAGQLQRIAELQAANEAVGEELARELEAAEEESKSTRDFFHQVADECLRLKPLR